MALFPSDRYTPDAIYVLSNGYYIDLKKNGPELAAVTKTPEGAVWNEGDPSFAAGPQVLVEEAILNLPPEFGNIEVVEIIQKQTPPPPPKNIQFNLKGKVLTVKGDAIIGATIKAFLFEKPPPPDSLPRTFTTDPLQYQDLTAEIGAAISLAPISVDTNGNFILEYYGENEIDFNQTYIEVKAANFFPKTIGPTLTKTGEKSISTTTQSEQFTGSTSVIDSQVFQQEDEKYRAIITLKNSTGEISKGEAISLNRETAKKIARSKAEQGFIQLDSKEENTIVIDLYDLGKIVLKSEEINLEEQTIELKSQIQEGENAVIENIAKSQLGFEVKIASFFAKQKENLKAVMLPFILGIIASFGPSIVNSILTNKKNALDDMVCPDPEKIKRAIRMRNKLVRDLNKSYKIIRTVSKILNVTNALLIGLRIGLSILQILTAIPTTPFTPFGLKEFYSGLVEKGFKISEDNLKKAKINITILSILVGTIGVVLGAILDLLNKLDFMLQSCSEEINSETGEPNVSFIEINNELNTYIDSSTNQIEDIIDPLTNKPLPYKGFTFEIKNDTSQNFQYPKRYAIARNIQGIQVLRSESSFASSPEILIEELKFVIDKDNLRAD